MKSFARTTKLPSIAGRAGYMSDPGRQEEIVLESEKVDWQPYIDYEASQHKTNARQNEGREMMVSLSNDWYELPKDELKRRVDLIAKTVVGENRPYQWAIHWNKARTNLHVHIIFSERLRVKEPSRWDRDIYLRDDGKVARKKSERAREPDGTFKPPVHRKGELKSDPFTAKDAKFKSKEWLHETKQDLRQLMTKEWGVKFERQPYLPEFHEGKGPESEIIKKKNIVIRENNRRLDILESQGERIYGLIEDLKAARNEARKNPDLKDQTALLWQDSEGNYKVTVFHNPDRAIFRMEDTAGRFVEPEKPEITAPEEPVHQDPKQELPEKDAGNAINAENSPAADVSDKKESQREPAAPVERKGIIERIRDIISSFVAQRAEKAAGEQAKKNAADQARRPTEAERATQDAAAAVQRMNQIPEEKSEKKRKPSLNAQITAAEERNPDKTMYMDEWKAQIATEKQKKKDLEAISPQNTRTKNSVKDKGDR